METQRPSEVMSLVDLQKFLAGELANTESDPSFHRAFTPLTDGLGLESPKQPVESFAPPPPKKEEAAVVAAPPKPEEGPAIPAPAPLKVESAIGPPQSKEPQVIRPAKIVLDDEDLPPVDPLLATKRPTSDFFAPEVKEHAEPMPFKAPPPIPSAGFFRRFQAGIIDQVIVLGVWAVVVTITSQVLAKGEENFVTRLTLDMQNPTFLRFALLEFATLWLAYFAICLGAMDMTLGMWAWGLRVGYTNGARGFKKWLRIIFSLAFLAPILPSVLLIFRYHGRNLLDALSGTSLYRA